VRVAVNVQRQAFDILHGEIGQAVCGDTAIQESCNVVVIESGEGLAFVSKTV
jgi:hypothetical protein